MKPCVVIPAYNEALAITDVVSQVRKQGWEVVVIDDGSADNTADRARQGGATVIRNPRNEGKGSSLIKGFGYCLDKDFDAVITMDADGQHSPADIPNFIRAAEASASKVFVGNRMPEARAMPMVRLLTNKFMSWIISRIARQRIPDTQCGFRLIRRDVLERIDLRARKYEIESEVLIKAGRLGARIESVPIKTIYAGSKSQINPFIDTLRFIKFIFRFVPWAGKRERE